MAKKISKILIANRGEIALRIIRACKELHIETVAIFSEADVHGLWIIKADECYPILGNPVEAYLDQERIVFLAKKTNCDAIHPGYGFLSENADFAQLCEDNDITFIGPKAEHIKLFGDKMAAKEAMKNIGVPVLDGINKPAKDKAEGRKIAQNIGFPVMIKAAFGGGGKGMRIVIHEDTFNDMFDAATHESLKYFGKSELFIEKYIVNPRHIEVQIIADKYGNVIHLGERDCSIQRRHQKVIEIAPSPALSYEARRELYRVSTKAMFKLGYENVGTVEFVLDEEDNIYFIEMNTRVQVEHTVTEIITGVDIIQRMIEIASGDKLQFLQEEVQFRGYAIQFRINSEDPQNNFIPSTGTVNKYFTPGGPGIRLDTSLYTGYTLPTCYDSMIGKLIVYAFNWEGAVNKASRALGEYYIDGFKTNIPLHREIVKDSDFKAGHFNTGYLEKKMDKFHFDALSSIASEEEKMNNIANLLEKIKNQNDAS